MIRFHQNYCEDSFSRWSKSGSFWSQIVSVVQFIARDNASIENLSQLFRVHKFLKSLESLSLQYLKKFAGCILSYTVYPTLFDFARRKRISDTFPAKI